MIRILASLFSVLLISIMLFVLIPVEIKDTDNGKTFEILRFRIIRITLLSNATTGYSWQVISPTDTKILRKYYSVYNPAAAGLVGAPGQQIFTFRAIAPGTAVIKLVYLRPWEGLQKDSKPFSVTIHVR
ncbi:MAG: protease inhibitor I42 family protein [Candidatus Omnitrophica bacterium]|nr:protease inhibitor I42 family protein [Candidatus Omnitrophota bacterium]